MPYWVGQEDIFWPYLPVAEHWDDSNELPDSTNYYEFTWCLATPKMIHMTHFT